MMEKSAADGSRYLLNLFGRAAGVPVIALGRGIALPPCGIELPRAFHFHPNKSCFLISLVFGNQLALEQLKLMFSAEQESLNE
jgi:hypothetical protein